MITLINDGNFIVLQGKTGTVDSGSTVSLKKDKIESIKVGDKDAVVISMYSTRTNELRAYQTETEGGIMFTDSFVCEDAYQRLFLLRDSQDTPTPKALE